MRGSSRRLCNTYSAAARARVSVSLASLEALEPVGRRLPQPCTAGLKLTRMLCTRAYSDHQIIRSQPIQTRAGRIKSTTQNPCEKHVAIFRDFKIALGLLPELL